MIEEDFGNCGKPSQNPAGGIKPPPPPKKAPVLKDNNLLNLDLGKIR